MERLTTEVSTGLAINPDVATLLSFGYLKRNDFKQFNLIGQRLISAKDGTRTVLVWIDICAEDERPDLSFVPVSVATLALETSARLDVLRYIINGERVTLKHTMNALVES